MNPLAAVARALDAAGFGPPAAAPEAARLLRFIEETPVSLWTTDLDLRITWGGGGGLIAEAQPAVGKTLSNLLGAGPAVAPAEEAHRRALAGEPADCRIEWGGKAFDLHCAPLRSDAGPPQGVLGLALDVTRRRRSEEQLHDSREQFRALAHTLESIREEEQSRIARDVHDELGQSLAALRFDLAWFAGQLPRRSRELREHVQQMTTQVDGVIAAVREIAADLRPPVLEEVGLAAALEFLAKRMAAKARRPCIVDVLVDDGVLDTERGVALYRLLQEAMRNAVCHSGCTWVAVEVRVVAGAVVLKVMDDGTGIREEDTKSPSSVGLVGMRERATAFGGTVEFAAIPGGGTTVTVRLPSAHATSPEATA